MLPLFLVHQLVSRFLLFSFSLLNVHNVLYVLSAVKCVESYREVMELLGGEGYV